MAKVTQHLWFDRDMEGALALYTSLIPGSSVDWTSALPADSPSGPAGSVKMAGFTLGGQSYQAMECPQIAPFTYSFSIMVECEDQAEIDRLWDALGEGGEHQPCGWVRDRWGLEWQIAPKGMLQWIQSPDRAKARRVAEAMLKMGNIDIATLEAAAAEPA